MGNMFYNCVSLTSLNISNYDTSKVINMGNMFYNCILLTSLDLSNFDTSKVINMKNMFYNCTNLKKLDVSNFDTSKVIDMKNMFYSCISLTSLNLSNFDTSSIIDISSIFEDYINLEYLNFYSFISNENMKIKNVFKGTPDECIYCINNEAKAEDIIDQLKIKQCKYRDCSFDWNENKLNRLEEKKNNIEIFNDKCIFKYIKYICKDFILTNRISNTTIYSYEINSEISELKNKYSNLTYLYFTRDIIDYLLTLYNLEKEEKIYILVIDYPSNDSNTVTSDYDYKLILENGTELNLSNINEVININISVPIRDLNLSKFNYAKIFSEQGYDIYDAKSDFYNDICTPAYIEKNDIILKDRKNEIYPNNITLCKENCKYIRVDLEDKSIICECNLNINKNYNSSKKIDFLIEEDKDTFFSYFLDNINYKIFKCYKLLLVFDNLKNNLAFYIILIIFFIIIKVNLYLFIQGISYLRTIMFKQIPSEKEIIKEIKRKKTNNHLLTKGRNKMNPIKRKNEKSISLNLNNHHSKDKKIPNLIFQNNNKSKTKKFRKMNFNLINLNIKKTSKILNLYGSEFNNILSKYNKQKKKINKLNNNDKNKNLNDLPYSLAIIKDKRNIIQIFISIIFQKIDLIYLFIGEEKVKTILICQYILSLSIDLFFNALLYSDDVVSHKYHNNGKLDFVVTLIISLLSNIITSFICYFINLSKEIEERLEKIIEIKKEYWYLIALSKYFKYFKIKIIFFFINQILIICCLFYYLSIFCIVYNYSQISLLINYFYSLLEGLLKSIIITVIIAITRKISIV